MTLKQLRRVLNRIDPNLDCEVLARCQWDGETPNGPVFATNTITVELSHSDEEPAVILDCGQNDE